MIGKMRSELRCDDGPSELVSDCLSRPETVPDQLDARAEAGRLPCIYIDYIVYGLVRWTPHTVQVVT